MTHHLAHVLSIWPQYRRPAFQFDYKARVWYIEDGNHTSTGETPLEALYHFAVLSQIADLSVGMGEQWWPVINYLQSLPELSHAINAAPSPQA